MKRKEIEFDGDDLVASVESYARHLQRKEKLTLKSTTVYLPQPASPMGPKEIVALRKKLSLSQAVFARLLNVPTVTEISWEHGRRRPTGAAVRLLDLVQRNPEVLYSLCKPRNGQLKNGKR
jgi:putative transcriptional regulator